MLAAARSLEAGSSFLARKKARQARSGHRGYVLEATRSLEAGSSFLARKKARQARLDTGGMCWRRRVPSKPGAISSPVKKESASDTRRLFFAKSAKSMILVRRTSSIFVII
ncbi:MAG: hypothetical protein FWF77_07170 [Defluviitaleaceae bacterium]|nr:hypothetical protein [Defluviitaleaceae bacterium]